MRARRSATRTAKPRPSRCRRCRSSFPLDQTWSLKDINDKPIPAGLDASLKIDGNLRGSGYTGCNSWSATLYPVKDQHLLIGPPVLTKKQCAKDLMAIEFSFLSALPAIRPGTSSTATSSSRGRRDRCASRARSDRERLARGYSPAATSRIVAGPASRGDISIRRLWKAMSVPAMADRDQRHSRQLARDGP